MVMVLILPQMTVNLRNLCREKRKRPQLLNEKIHHRRPLVNEVNSLEAKIMTLITLRPMKHYTFETRRKRRMAMDVGAIRRLRETGS